MPLLTASLLLPPLLLLLPLSLLLLLRYSVGRITTEPSPRELPPLDFQLKVKQFFPQDGSDMTPTHTCAEFVWKDYAPMVFRKLRESFNIDAGQSGGGGGTWGGGTGERFPACCPPPARHLTPHLILPLRT